MPGPPHQHSCKLVDLSDENWNARILFHSAEVVWSEGQSWLHEVSWHSSPKCCCMWQCLASATVAPQKTVLFTSFHSPPIQGNKKIKKGRPNHRLPQRLQSSCNFSIQRCDFCHFAKKLLHFCMSFLSSLGNFIKDGQGVGTTPNFQNHFIMTGELCCKKHVYHQTIWTTVI